MVKSEEQNMHQGYLCPRCGKSLRYIPEYRNWYCDFCRIYPHVQQIPMPIQYYYPPPRDDSSKTIVWIILILVILFFVLPIILGILMFIFLPPFDNGVTTPTGSMHFEQDLEEFGIYTGNFISLSDRIFLDDISISITDDDLGSSASLNPLVDNGFVEIINGMNLTFNDVNNNERMDTIDTFIINNGAPDDRIRVIYRPTGGLIASYTLG